MKQVGSSGDEGQVAAGAEKGGSLFELSVPARRTLVTLALLLGTFLSSIEVTVVATAMPSIVQHLGSLSLYPWVFSAYLLTQTVSIPLYGRLADLVGRRYTYVGGVTLFLVGSALCGLSDSMEFLVLARAVQGLGAGAVLPLTMTIFGDLYEVSQRTRLQGLFSMVWGVSSVLGPLTGGAIVLHASWRWVFLLNLPFGLVSALTVGLLLREKKVVRKHRLDIAGALLLAVSTLLIMAGLLPEGQRPLQVPVYVWLGAALITALAFYRREVGHPEPLLPMGLFRDRLHVAANATGVLFGVVLLGLVGYVPLYVQVVKGGSPVTAGAVLIPLSLGWTLASFTAGRLVFRLGFQVLVRVGCTLVATGMTVAFAGVWLDLWWLGIAGEVLYGLGMGASVSSFTVSVQERVVPKFKGIATALTQFSRSIGGAVGVAVLGAVLTLWVGEHLPEGGVMKASEVAHLESGLRAVFSVVCGVAILAGVFGIALFPKVSAGREEN